MKNLENSNSEERWLTTLKSHSGYFLQIRNAMILALSEIRPIIENRPERRLLAYAQRLFEEVIRASKAQPS